VSFVHLKRADGLAKTERRVKRKPEKFFQPAKTGKKSIQNRDLGQSHWSAGILPASWLKHQETRRLEAGAPS
jgi:hypothetical protein